MNQAWTLADSSKLAEEQLLGSPPTAEDFCCRPFLLDGTAVHPWVFVEIPGNHCKLWLANSHHFLDFLPNAPSTSVILTYM